MCDQQEPLPPPPSPLPTPDQSLTQEKQRQMFQEHTTALSPTPQHLPFVLDQQLTPGKNWPYKHAHTHTKNTAAQICTGSTVVRMNEQHTHTYAPSAVQIPSVSLIVATLGSGLVSASRIQGLSGQLAWLILLLEATGSQTKGQGPPGGHRAGILGIRECAICSKCRGCLFVCSSRFQILCSWWVIIIRCRCGRTAFNNQKQEIFYADIKRNLT